MGEITVAHDISHGLRANHQLKTDGLRRRHTSASTYSVLRSGRSQDGYPHVQSHDNQHGFKEPFPRLGYLNADQPSGHLYSTRKHRRLRFLAANNSDYLIKVVTRGMSGYDAFYQKLINNFDLATVTGFFSMEAIIDNRGLGLNRML